MSEYPPMAETQRFPHECISWELGLAQAGTRSSSWLAGWGAPDALFPVQSASPWSMGKRQWSEDEVSQLTPEALALGVAAVASSSDFTQMRTFLRSTTADEPANRLRLSTLKSFSKTTWPDLAARLKIDGHQEDYYEQLRHWAIASLHLPADFQQTLFLRGWDALDVYRDIKKQELRRSGCGFTMPYVACACIFVPG